MQSWLEGRNWLRKGAQVTERNASLRILSSKVDSNTWESFTSSELKHRQKHLTWAKEKRTGLLLSGPKSSFQIKLNWKSRSQSLEEVWRGTESMLLEVQCEVSTVSDDLGCHVICWCWSTGFSEVHSQRSHPAGIGTCPHCQMYQKLVQWPWCYCAWLASKGRLTWTPKRIYGVLSRGRWEIADPPLQMTWRPLSKQPGLPLHPSSATGWLTPCHTALMQ